MGKCAQVLRDAAKHQDYLYRQLANNLSQKVGHLFTVLLVQADIGIFDDEQPGVLENNLGYLETAKLSARQRDDIPVHEVVDVELGLEYMEQLSVFYRGLVKGVLDSRQALGTKQALIPAQLIKCGTCLAILVVKGDIEDVFADLLGRAGAEVIRYCPLTVRESLHDCLDKISLAGAIGPVD